MFQYWHLTHLRLWPSHMVKIGQNSKRALSDLLDAELFSRTFDLGPRLALDSRGSKLVSQELYFQRPPTQPTRRTLALHMECCHDVITLPWQVARNDRDYMQALALLQLAHQQPIRLLVTIWWSHSQLARKCRDRRASLALRHHAHSQRQNPRVSSWRSQNTDRFVDWCHGCRTRCWKTCRSAADANVRHTWPSSAISGPENILKSELPTTVF